MKVTISRGRCKLQDLLDARGWSHEYYGNLYGRGRRMITHFCNGTRIMLPEDLRAAEIIFGCNWKDLYEWTVTIVEE